MNNIMFRAAIPVLALTAFTAGLSEFVIIGLLGSAAQSLSVSVPEAGLLISIYALGITVGSPVLVLMTLRQPGRLLCIILMILFATLNAGFTFMSDFGFLLILRFFAGIIHGTYFSIASASLPSVISPHKTPLAIALMFSGLTLAMVAGVPVGMMAAEYYGWQGPFMGISVISGVSALMLLKVLPESFGTAVLTRERLTFKSVFTRESIRPYCFTILAFGGGFSFFAYAEPWLLSLSGLNAKHIALMIGLAGLGSLAGNIMGGVLPNKLGMRKSLCVTVLLQVTGLTILTFHIGQTCPGIGLFVWSVGAFATAPMVQSWAVVSADRLNPRISAAMNVAAFNLGTSLSTLIGSSQIAAGGLEYLPVTAAIIVLLALPFCPTSQQQLSTGKN